MSNKKNAIVSGDQVRIRYGRCEGQTGTVGNVMWRSNQFGAYAQVYIVLDDGSNDIRTMGDLEKVKETPGIAQLPTASTSTSQRGNKR